MIGIFYFSKSCSASSGQLHNGKYLLNFAGFNIFSEWKPNRCYVSVLAVISALIVIVAMEATVFATSLHTIRTKRHSTPRWTIPCGPGHVAISTSIAKKSVGIEGVIMEQLKIINRKATETKEKVAHLEELYVSINLVHLEFLQQF